MWRSGWWSALALVCAACGGGSDGGGSTPVDAAPHADAAVTPDAVAPDASPADASPADASPADAAPPGGRLLEADCDPIGVHCGFPFPSDVYLEADPSAHTPSGKVVRFREGTLPKTFGRTPVPLDMFTDLDGWSPASGPMTYMPDATVDGLASPLTVETTTHADSPTIILDATTGELVPHFVNVDETGNHHDGKALILRPVRLLKTSTRYIVALRRVKDTHGAEIAPTDVFKALRDGTDDPDPSVASRRAHYDEIFAKLTAAGVDRASLQIAWDFTTASKEALTGPMLKVRDAALAVVGADGPEYTIKSVEQHPSDLIKTRVVVTVHVPRFLNTEVYNPQDPVPYLLFDAQGQPMQNGWMDMDAIIEIPNVVDEPGRKLGVLQNGHGLFGSKEEGQNGYLAMAASRGWATIAVDLFGFAEHDALLALEALSSRPQLLKGFVDRQIQGMVDQLLAMRMMIGRVARDGITDADGNVLLAPGAIDPTLRAYRGDSQGGIMGGTYMSISTDVTRGLLGEPGTPYSLLLNRSKDWPTYGAVLAGSYHSDLDIQLMLGIIQLRWDHSEPAGFVPYLAHDPLPGTPEHRVLMHDALGDHQVYTGGAQIMARAIGAKLLRSNDAAQPFIREVYGLDPADAPLQGESALVEFEFGLQPEPLTNLPSSDGCDPHDRVRVLTPALDQADHFFKTGEIGWFCDGVCNCDVNPEREEDGCRDSFDRQCH
jgi:hypothetical protein